jgi:hypothetical protein
MRSLYETLKYKREATGYKLYQPRKIISEEKYASVINYVLENAKITCYL